jgi:acetone carboxylase gamma subunit
VKSRVWPRKSDGEDNSFKADARQKKRLFTVKNPRNIPARRLALKPNMKHRAIKCHSGCASRFCDIAVSDNCNANIDSRAYFDSFEDSYANDTGPDIVFTDFERFSVREIEVFEMTE